MRQIKDTFRRTHYKARHCLPLLLSGTRAWDGSPLHHGLREALAIIPAGVFRCAGRLTRRSQKKPRPKPGAVISIDPTQCVSTTRAVRIVCFWEDFEMTTKEALRKAGRWLKDEIVQDVPDEDALCEFFCRKGQCQWGDWATCKRRLADVEDLRKWKATLKT